VLPLSFDDLTGFTARDAFLTGWTANAGWMMMTFDNLRQFHSARPAGR
jgi:hypothetical protein